MRSITLPSPLLDSAWVRMVLIALAYLVSGKLALLLAIPPGYATAIWPPAGIALGALLVLGQRYWPGVLLGSFLTNVSTSFDGSTLASSVTSLAMTSSIAIGAALQAYLGASLIRHVLGERIQLNNERKVFTFLALGGPLACWVNASVGVGALTSFGAIPPSAVAYSWCTWWVGDTIGTLIFAPLMLMWCGADQSLRSRRMAVTLPLGGMLFTAILVFIYSSGAEWRDMEAEFERDASDFAATIERRLALNEQNLRSLSTLYAISQPVDAARFARMTAPMLAEHPEVTQLGWAPQRDRAFPLLFSQAPAAVQIAPGTDLQSIPAIAKALARMRAGVVVAVTEPVELPGGPSVLLVHSVYSEAVQPGQAASPGDARLSGLLYLNMRISALLEADLNPSLAMRRMQLQVQDTQAGDLIYSSNTPGKPAGKPLALRADVDLVIADRVWRLSFTPTVEFIPGNHAVMAWLVLAGGLLLSAMVGAGALILTGRTIEVEGLVGARTEELADINSRLAEKICDHVRIEHALAGEKQFLSMVLENLDEGIVALNTQGKTTMANRAAKDIHRRITGLRHSGATWTRAEIFFASDATTPIPPHELPSSRALRGETVREFEMVSMLPGLASVTLVVNAQPLLDRDGVQTGVIGMIRDITDIRKADRLKREFVAVVSHELRTPLTSIRGSLGLVNAGTAGVLPDKARKLVDIAYRNSDRLATLINDILDIEKIESGKLALSSEPHSMRALVLQAIEAHSGYAHECDVSISSLETAADASVSVDANRLLQVLANLLSNASKFSPRRATVEVDIEVRGARVRVSVHDQGPGIPAEFRPYMFQKFSQVDGSDTRAKPGTGLGLAICKGLIGRMHGSIDYAPNYPRGTVFFIDLPIDSTASLQVDSATPGHDADPASPTPQSLSNQGHDHG